MKVIDIVKPKPKTELEAFNRWLNRMESELRSMPGYGKRIIVKSTNEVTCVGYGSRKCRKNGEHSWFNHAMDTYQH